MEKTERIVTDCIQEIKSGKAALAECLDRYPEKRHEIEPLIKMALNIREPMPFILDNDYKQVARASLLQQIRNVGPKRSEPFKDFRDFLIQPQLSWARIASFIIVVFIVMSMLAGGTVYAAQRSLPGDLVYPVKTTAENIRLFLAGNEFSKAELNLEFAWTRLEEMSKLAVKNESKAEIAVQAYKGKMEIVTEQVREIADTSTRSRLIIRVLENLKQQTDFCDSVLDKAPMYTGPIGEADNLSVNYRLQFMKILSQDDMLSAAQINMNAMENRLHRAQSKAISHQYRSMQQALLQYQQFNRAAVQILENALSTGNRNTISGSMNSQTLSGYLGILDGMSQLVPGEYRSDIDTSREMTLQFQIQVNQESQQKNGFGSDVEGDNQGNSNGSASDQDSTGTSQSQDSDTGPDAEAPGNGDAPGPGPGGSADGSPSGDDSAPSPGPGGSTMDNNGSGKTG